MLRNCWQELDYLTLSSNGSVIRLSVMASNHKLTRHVNSIRGEKKHAPNCVILSCSLSFSLSHIWFLTRSEYKPHPSGYLLRSLSKCLFLLGFHSNPLSIAGGRISEIPPPRETAGGEAQRRTGNLWLDAPGPRWNLVDSTKLLDLLRY